MDTSAVPVSSPATSINKSASVDPCAGLAPVPPAHQYRPRRKERSKKKTLSFNARSDFQRHVRNLPTDGAEYLDQIRDDLQEAIEKVGRIQRLFVKVLNSNGSKSQRVRSIAQTIDLVSFYCDQQRKIVETGVLTILESKAKLVKEREEQAKREKREAKAKRKFTWLNSPDESD